MRSQWKRLLLAAALSLSCAGGTVIWYRMTESRFEISDATPLAQVSSVDDEVLRRPSTRLLWLPVNTGDNLYTGETIRTSSRGELHIQLTQGGSIRLEPDSLIVLQENRGQISLDLMEGSLFVDAKQTDTAASGQAATTPSLVLNSKSGRVDLTGATAALSKTSGDRVDLQVLEGSAKVEGADGQSREVSSGRSSSLDASGAVFDTSNWLILSPELGKPLFVDPDAEKNVTFKWRGLPKEWQVSLWAGETKRGMKELATADVGAAEVSAKLPLGKFWWKLVAKDPNKKIVAEKASASRLDLLARRLPSVIFPLADAVIPIERSPAAVTFRWEKLEMATQLRLEVGADPDLKAPLVNRVFRQEEELTVPNLKDGTYYWRVSAMFDGAEDPTQGRIQRMTLESPSARAPVQFNWALPREKQTQSFATEPQLELKWEPTSRQNEIQSYRIYLEHESNPQASARLEAQQPGIQAKVASPGRYIASIEAVAKDGSVIGRSSPLPVVSQELPRLAPPALTPATGKIQTGGDGRTELTWTPIEGAKEYRLTILNSAGEQLAQRSYKRANANLQNLLPGEYTVKLETIDQWGRPGEVGEPRVLVVPEKSNLKAPSLKRIKVN